MIKRIQTSEDKERKRKRNNMIISIFMLVILVATSAGFAFVNTGGTPSSDESSNVNNTINNLPQGNYVQYGGQQIPLIYNKTEVGDVEVTINKSINSYAGETLYLDIETDETVAIQEFGNTLGRVLPKIQRACLNECEENIPERSCDEGIVVYRNIEGESRVYQEKECVFIEGDIRAVDAFIYSVFGEL